MTTTCDIVLVLIVRSAMIRHKPWHSLKFQCPISTVPFRLIHPVTRHKAFGPALISVHVTRHIDFGHMWLMVYSKFWSKNGLKGWKCRSKSGLSHVTPQVDRMSKCAKKARHIISTWRKVEQESHLKSMKRYFQVYLKCQTCKKGLAKSYQR